MSVFVNIIGFVTESAKDEVCVSKKFFFSAEFYNVLHIWECPGHPYLWSLLTMIFKQQGSYERRVRVHLVCYSSCLCTF